MPLRHFAIDFRANDAVRQALAGWRADGLAPPDAAARLWKDTEPGVAQWQRWLTQAMLILGVALLASGVIVFLAFNWQAMHRFTRFGLVAAALLVLAAIAWRRPPSDAIAHSALWAAQLMSGALLAVIGQVYQTGADPWQLFALWAALCVPWAIAARAAPHWWMVIVLANLALLRWFGVRLGAATPLDLLFGVPGGKSAAAILLGAAVAQLIVWLLLQTRCERFGLRGQTGPRMLALLVCAHAVWLGLHAMFARDPDLLALASALLAALAAPAGLAWWFRLRGPDLFVLSAAALAGIVLVVAAVGRLMTEGTGSGIFLLLGLLTVMLSAAAASWLKRLAARQRAERTDGQQIAPRHADADADAVALAVTRAWRALSLQAGPDRQEPSARPPWSIRMLTGAAGGLGGLFFQLFLLGTAFVTLRESPGAMLACGVALVGIAALLYRRGGQRLGIEQFALATSMMGQALATYAAADLLGGDEAVESAVFWMGLAAIEVTLYLLMTNRLHRLLSALAACAGVTVALAIVIAKGEPDRWQGMAWALAVVSPVACLLAMVFCRLEAALVHAGRQPRMEPAADALLLSGLAGSLLLTGISHPVGGLFEPHRDIGPGHWMGGSAIALLLAGFCWLEASRLQLPRLARIGIALLAAAAGAVLAGAPGVVAGLLAFAMALRRSSVAWLAYALAAVGAGFLWYYSALHWTLAIKAGTLIVAGALVLAGRRWLGKDPLPRAGTLGETP